MTSIVHKTNKHASFIAFTAFMIISTFLVPTVEGHGYMTTPRTRNEFAAQEGVDGGGTAGLPPREYCTHCLNTNSGVCGSSPNFNYDDYLDSEGNPMPWISQESYVEGQIITVKSYLDTPHNGHLELKACALGSASTQECFDTPGHALEFMEDVLYGMPKDPSHPYRGYYAGGQGGGIKDHEMKFKLPAGIYGDQVMLQYKYITANSCSPPGYTPYFNGANSKNEKLPESYWTPGLGDCTPPYPNDGTRGTTWPEQFFNCAEVTITSSAPSPPTTPPPPSTTSQPTPSPTQPPTAEGVGCCSWPPFTECSQPNNVWCQESKDRCEGSCSGKWLVTYPPTTPSPTSAPVASPTSAPNNWNPPPTPAPSAPAPTPTSTRGCCSINFKTCHHPEGTFCWESEENCVGPCGKYWLPNGPVNDCTAQWDPCSNDDECCAHAVCAYDGVCRADTWATPPPAPSSPVSPTPSPVASNPTPSPTEKTTSVPSKAPTTTPATPAPTPLATPAPTGVCKSWCETNTAPWTKKCTWAKCTGCGPCSTTAPTTSPTPLPTSAPTTSPTPSPTASPTTATTDPPTDAPNPSPTHCCTFDFYHCSVDDSCNESSESCQATCGGTWMSKSSEAMSCINKYGECTSASSDACCGTSSCVGGNDYKQCV